MNKRNARTARSDALVLFGVTGDLAHKMIFPALYAMAKRGVLNVPVVGVASSKMELWRNCANARRTASGNRERSMTGLPCAICFPCSAM